MKKIIGIRIIACCVLTTFLVSCASWPSNKMRAAVKANYTQDGYIPYVDNPNVLFNPNMPLGQKSVVLGDEAAKRYGWRYHAWEATKNTGIGLGVSGAAAGVGWGLYEIVDAIGDSGDDSSIHTTYNYDINGNGNATTANGDAVAD